MILDIILAAVLVIMAIRGVGRGIVREALSFAGLTVALFLGAYFYPHLKSYLGDHAWSGFASFAIIILAVVICLNLIETLLFRFLRRIKLSFIDFLLGCVVGIFEGVILVMLLLAALVALPWPAFMQIDSLLKDSQLANLFLPYVDQAYRGWNGWLNSRV